ncbi:MAG: Rrf2 family transcriptional regulator [Phycisphaerales bacterium]
MIRYGKSTQNAVAAMSKLAEVYRRGLRLSSREVADARDMPQTLAAKLLTQLSQVGLVSGSPGRAVGTRLAKPPGEICLYDAAVFERVEEKTACRSAATGAARVRNVRCTTRSRRRRRSVRVIPAQHQT